MKQQVLFIHGAGGEAHVTAKFLAASLQNALGDDYDVRYPQMPQPANPKYEAWRDVIVHELSETNNRTILVGHSLGGSILLKVLSETPIEKSVAGLYLIAVPYWGAEDWEVDAFTLDRDFAVRLPAELPIVFYYSRDDAVFPFAHQKLYAQHLPAATFREFTGRDHQFNNDLSAIAHDIVYLGNS